MESAVQLPEVDVAISDEVLQELSKALELEEFKGKALRVTIAGVGCGGPQLGLVMDEPKDEDKIFESDTVMLMADEGMQQEITNGGGLKMEYINDPMRGQGIAISFAKQADCSSGCGCGCG